MEELDNLHEIWGTDPADPDELSDCDEAEDEDMCPHDGVLNTSLPQPIGQGLDG